MSEIEPGQRLYYVPRKRDGKPQWLTVTSVGRRWATCGEGYDTIRVDIDTMQVDGRGYSSPGRCYLSEAEHSNDVRRKELWDQIREATLYSGVPKHLDVSDCEAVRAALKGAAREHLSGRRPE